MVWLTFGAMIFATGCGRGNEAGSDTANAPVANEQPVPQSLPMGGEKSVMTFFITSTGTGKGGDFGGLRGADVGYAERA